MLHRHGLEDDGAGLPGAVTVWLDRKATGGRTVLRSLGLDAGGGPAR